MMVCPGINGMTWPSMVIELGMLEFVVAEFDVLKLDMLDWGVFFELISLFSFLSLSCKVSCSIIPMRDLTRLLKCRIQIEVRLKVAMHQMLFKH